MQKIPINKNIWDIKLIKLEKEVEAEITVYCYSCVHMAGHKLVTITGQVLALPSVIPLFWSPCKYVEGLVKQQNCAVLSEFTEFLTINPKSWTIGVSNEATLKIWK